jgi:hypothetical protein
MGVLGLGVRCMASGELAGQSKVHDEKHKWRSKFQDPSAEMSARELERLYFVEDTLVGRDREVTLTIAASIKLLDSCV